MSTRHRDGDGPPAQNGFASAPEFLELRGINGVAVSMRTAILLKEEKRALLWFIQAMSAREGGLKRLARELLEMFPERLGTPEMHNAGVKKGKIFPLELAKKVRRQIWGSSERFTAADVKGEELLDWCRHAAAVGKKGDGQWQSVFSMDEFLERLCINPRVSFSLPDEPADFSECESSLAIEQDPEMKRADIEAGCLIYFRDIIGALVEYKKRYEEKIRNSFCLTAIGKKVWKALDDALFSGRMVAVDGLQGRGKTDATKAWCEMHLGTARFVSLRGVSTKTTVFRRIAKALGVASSYTRTATDMQARIEDVLERSRIMLVLDEAHFLFNQSRRVYTRPELVDWIDTAICNAGVPCALITTPQFMVCMTRAADQAEWNYRQFERRVKWVKLPDANTESDIFGVARAVFRNTSEVVIKKIVGYALSTKRDLSAVGDVAKEIQTARRSEDLAGVSIDEVNKAIYRELFPSDKAFLEAMDQSRSRGRRRRPENSAVANLELKKQPGDELDKKHFPAVEMTN